MKIVARRTHNYNIKRREGADVDAVVKIIFVYHHIPFTGATYD
jgi:hypothetical protein